MRRRMSLTELSKRVGVSKGLISQIERGLSNPSLPVIRAIARVLEVPLFTLFVEDDPRDGLVRRNDRQQLHVPGSSVRRELLVPDLHRRIILVSVYFEPGDVTQFEHSTHPGEECVFVLQGSVEIEVNSNRVILNCGDSYYFNSKLPHVFRNVSEEPAETISAISAPS